MGTRGLRPLQTSRQIRKARWVTRSLGSSRTSCWPVWLLVSPRPLLPPSRWSSRVVWTSPTPESLTAPRGCWPPRVLSPSGEDDDDLWWRCQVQGFHRLRYADHEERGLHEHDEGCRSQHPPWCRWCWCARRFRQVPGHVHRVENQPVRGCCSRVVVFSISDRQPMATERDDLVFYDNWAFSSRNFVEPPTT